MALHGRLEDMNLLEILQIVAFSKKTGTLELRGNRSKGAVLFRRGMLVCAFSSSSAGVVASFADRPMDDAARALLAEHIRTALRELVVLREGRFEFRLCQELPTRWAGLELAAFLASDGIDPQALLLELARELDESREATSRWLESSRELGAGDPVAGKPPEVAREGADPRSFTIVVADDEPQVVRVVTEELERAGFHVESAPETESALRLIDRLLGSHRAFAVLTDDSMPSSGRDSFDGGFEILERLAAVKAAAPVLLMAESLRDASRARASRLGVRKVAFKPALTKIHPVEYEADLRSFARELPAQLKALIARSAGLGSVAASEPDLNLEAVFEFLKSMSGRLASPMHGIARMILRVASKYVERAILFLVKDAQARGIAGIHHGRLMAESVASARGLVFELQQVQPFAEVVYSRAPVRVTDVRGSGIENVDLGRASELELLPLLLNHQVLAVLYCDNPNTGTPLTKLSGLKLFLVQAGMALENASLHRKLRSLEERHSLHDQGPLVQELSPLVREA